MPTGIYKRTDEMKRNMSLSHKGKGCGKNNHFYGKKHSEETRRKMSLAKKGKMIGKNHHCWQGDDVGYVSLHKWVQRHKPKTGTCQHCGRTNCRTENANISGEYKRDLDDYIELCQFCHIKFDRRSTEVDYEICKNGKEGAMGLSQ